MESPPATADVVVIGGGVVGLSAAYELAGQGRDTLVLDRLDVAEGCGIGSVGHIVPSHVVPLAAPGAVQAAARSILTRRGPVTLPLSADPSYLAFLVSFARHCTRRHVAAAAPALGALFALSTRLLQEWIDTERIDCALRHDGVLDIYGQDRAFGRAAAHALHLREFGVEAEVLNRDQVVRLEPSVTADVIGGVFYPGDHNLHPGRFLEGLADAARVRGAALLGGVEVLGVDHERGLRVSTTKGDIRAEHVVMAAGALTGRLSKASDDPVPVRPGRGFSLTVTRPERGPSRPLLLGEQHVAVAPMGDELRFSGWYELDRYDTIPVPQRLETIERLARSRLDFDQEVEVRERWAGLRPTTPDGLPIIGPSPRLDGVVYATGHAMLGVSLGPATGRLVAQIVSGEPTEIDISPFRSTRF